MFIDEIRMEASRLVDNLEYQYIPDSPTVKYYTKWDLYSKYVDSDISQCNHPGINIYSDNKVSINKASAMNSLIGKLVKPKESRIVSAHYMALRDAIILDIYKDSRINIYVDDRGMGRSLIHARHLVLKVREGVNASIEVHYEGFRDDALETLFIELVINRNTDVKMLLYSEPPKDNPSISILRTIIGENSCLKYSFISQGGYMHHHNVENLLYSRSRLYSGAAIVSREGEKIDYNIKTIHEGMRSKSDMRAQGIALDNGYVVTRGMVKIPEDGVWSSSTFQTGVTLLGYNAKGYTSPMMEIDTGKVLKALHEAKEYNFDYKHVFYLMTRGLNRDEAERLILYGILYRQIEFLDGDILNTANEQLRKIIHI
jgi:DNA-binding transcriptional ArsR family regulator